LSAGQRGVRGSLLERHDRQHARADQRDFELRCIRQVRADAEGIVSHAGAQLLAELAEAIRGARAAAHERAWDAGARPEEITFGVDATLLGAASEKEGAAGNYKGSFGFHPLLCYLDETGEPLAGLLRPGNAGSTGGAVSSGDGSNEQVLMELAGRLSNPGFWRQLANLLP
jgi:hypothetical protein